MGTFEVKTPKTAPAAKPKREEAGELTKALATTIRQARNSPGDGNAYLKLAFKNPYNLSLFGGLLAAAGLTMNPLLALVALGGEALWLLHAPSSKRLQQLLWDPRLEKLRLEIERQDREERIKGLELHDRERVEHLVTRQEDINRLAAQNPSFTGDLLRTELVKTRRLVDSFIDLMVTVSRYKDYLSNVDERDLENQRTRHETKIKTGRPDDPTTQIAKKNFAVVLKRLDKIHEIRQYLAVARAQLDLIENSFELIADQIVTMQSPQELSGQLDELLDGVESIKQTAADTERLLA